MSNKKTLSILTRNNNEDTLPKLLLRNCNHWDEKRVALRKKDQSVWFEHSWQDCCENVKAVFNGLGDLGFNTGETAAIIGDNSPEWFYCQLAIQACGGTVVGINPVRTTNQTKIIIDRAKPRVIFVQDQEQVDKLLGIMDQTPSVEKIIYWQTKGLKHYRDECLINYNTLTTLGREPAKYPAKNFEEKVNQSNGNDLAMLLCAWKSADTLELLPVTHDLIISSGETVIAADPVGDNSDYVCIMNPGWFFEQVLGFGISLLTGRRLNFAESGETAEVDLREISPHSLAYPSQMWDQLALSIQSNISVSGRLSRMLFNWGLSAGLKATDARFNGQRASLYVQVVRFLSEYTMFRPLRDKHGLDSTRVAYAAGGIVSPDTLRFFHAIGVNLKQIFATVDEGIVFNDPGEKRLEQ